MSKTFTSQSENFSVTPSGATISLEEVPELTFYIADLAGDVGELLLAAAAKDPIAVAIALTEIADTLDKIKKVVED